MAQSMQDEGKEIELVTWEWEEERSEGKSSARRGERRRARKRRQRRRRLLRTIRALAAVLVLVLLASFVSGRGIFAGHGLPALFAEHGDADVVTYVDENDAKLVSPEVYEGTDIREELLRLAGEDAAYRDICDHYDDYPEELLAALCSNSELLPFVQGWPDSDGKAHGTLTEGELEEAVPLLLQWDARWGYAPYGDSNIALSGCAPTCLSMVIVALTGDSSATPDEVAAYAETAGYYQEGTGTAWSFMTEGCQHFGVTGTEISLDEGVVRGHLEAGEPVICSMRPGDFTTSGHFIVLTGTKDGKITVHDPNSRARSGILWSYDTLAPQIKNLWAFSRGR